MVARAYAEVLERLGADEANLLLVLVLLALDRRAGLGRRQVKDRLAELSSGCCFLMRREGPTGCGLSLLLLLLALGGGAARARFRQLAGELGASRRHSLGGVATGWRGRDRRVGKGSRSLAESLEDDARAKRERSRARSGAAEYESRAPPPCVL